MLSRIAVIVVAVAAVAAVVIPGTAATEVVAPPAQALGSSHIDVWIKPGRKYVALGSSYAAGPGAAPIADVRCFRTTDDYPHLVAVAHRMRLTDVTCSGATTANILNTPQRPFADRPQIDAVTPDTDLVTITTGGNDIDYIGRLLSWSCANVKARFTHLRRCLHRRAAPPEPAPADYTAVERSIVDLIAAVRLRAPQAEILLVDYTPVLDARGTRCPLVPLTPQQAAQTVRIFDGLTIATARAARESGVRLISASRAGAAHAACSPDPWVRGLQFPVAYHPNRRGREALAQLVLAALRD